MTESALHRAVEIAGGQSALAKACGVKQAHVWNWINRGKKVPAEKVLDVERATGGQVKCSELRPDLYPPERFSEAS